MTGNANPSHDDSGGSAPAPPGFTAVAPEWLFSDGAAVAAPAIPAAESTLGFHPGEPYPPLRCFQSGSTATSPSMSFHRTATPRLTLCLTPGFTSNRPPPVGRSPTVAGNGAKKIVLDREGPSHGSRARQQAVCVRRQVFLRVSDNYFSRPGDNCRRSPIRANSRREAHLRCV